MSSELCLYLNINDLFLPTSVGSKVRAQIRAETSQCSSSTVHNRWKQSTNFIDSDRTCNNSKTGSTPNNRHSLQAETRSTREQFNDLSTSSNQLFQMGAMIRLKVSDLLRPDNHSSKLRQTINLPGRKKLVRTVKRIQSKSMFVKASVASSLLNKIEMHNSSVIFTSVPSWQQFAHHSTLCKLQEDTPTQDEFKKENQFLLCPINRQWESELTLKLVHSINNRISERHGDFLLP